MDHVKCNVLLPQKFWKESNSKDELKQKIERYFSISYPNYSVKRIEKSGESYIALCTREE
ncbi:hypothetical protein NKR74_14985 [Bacillus sp. 3103sda1]|nr:hypothetical protein [Bacillus sp. 3103sda1]MCP1124594.1 hypothetical protein [Bacillus sp. 3103sda1]